MAGAVGMTPGVLDWCVSAIGHRDVTGRDVLEVGAFDVNGSVRPHIEALRPRVYIGTDMLPGPGVDEVIPAESLIYNYEPDRFWLVVSTEMLEHAELWQDAVWNMMAVTAPGGVMVVTAAAPGFPRHDWPGDYWRFSIEDFARIWDGWFIEDLSSHPVHPGTFIRARKPQHWDGLGAWERIREMIVTSAPSPDVVDAAYSDPQLHGDP